MQFNKIDFTKKFLKQFRGLTLKQQDRFYEHLELFKQNPYDSMLRNHTLQGKYKGYRSMDPHG